MNKVGRVLSDDLKRLVDCLAASIPEGALEQMRTATPTLRTRLDEMETNLATIHASLVEGYGRWTRALEDLESVWALAVWRSAAEEPAGKASRLAA